MEYGEYQGVKISRLSLGTVQLGIDYGISNKQGKPKIEDAMNILYEAVHHGINCFDTAPVYGTSEDIIGQFMESNLISGDSFKPIIMTKIHPIKVVKKPIFDEIYDDMKRSIQLSLERLKIDKLPICLLHKASNITDNDGIITECLLSFKDEGLVEMIGASTYTPKDVEQFLKIEDFDVIQVPLNIFDLRLINSGLLDELNKKRKCVFVRSIFLQGLFFLNPEKLPKNVRGAKPWLMELNALSTEYETSIKEIAINFIKNLPGINSIIVGVESTSQLKENLIILESSLPSSDLIDIIYEKFNNIPEHIINPSLWNP
ncbi:MAG: aldo/keto reductase [Candidatus Hodarchaeota archaeon]